jgi:hypothetical protein
MPTRFARASCSSARRSAVAFAAARPPPLNRTTRQRSDFRPGTGILPGRLACHFPTAEVAGELARRAAAHTLDSKQRHYAPLDLVMPLPIPAKQISRQDEPLITTVLRRFQIVLGYSFLQLQERASVLPSR